MIKKISVKNINFIRFSLKNWNFVKKPVQFCDFLFSYKIWIDRSIKFNFPEKLLFENFCIFRSFSYFFLFKSFYGTKVGWTGHNYTAPNFLLFQTWRYFCFIRKSNLDFWINGFWANFAQQSNLICRLTTKKILTKNFHTFLYIFERKYFTIFCLPPTQGEA